MVTMSIRPRTPQRLAQRLVQALVWPSLDSIESLQAVEHFSTYICFVASCVDNVHGGVVHGNGGGRGYCDCFDHRNEVTTVVYYI